MFADAALKLHRQHAKTKKTVNDNLDVVIYS